MLMKLSINTAMNQDYTSVITEVCQLLFNAIRSRESSLANKVQILQGKFSNYYA